MYVCVCVRACVCMHWQPSGGERGQQPLIFRGWWCAAGAIGPASVEGAPA